MPLHLHSEFNVTFVRHGQTELNVHGLLQGQGKVVPLNEAGREQATLLGKHISNEKFSHVVSSDLLRTKETCQCITDENIDWKTGNKKVVYDELLRERSFGVLEGKHWSVIRDEERKQGKEREMFKPEGGESEYEVEERGIKFFEKLCLMCHNYHEQLLSEGKKLSDNPINILVVTHGGYLYTLNVSLSNYYHAHFPHGKLHAISPNTGRTKFKVTLTNTYAQDHKETHKSRVNSLQSISVSKGIQIQCEMLNHIDHLDDDDF